MDKTFDLLDKITEEVAEEPAIPLPLNSLWNYLDTQLETLKTLEGKLSTAGQIFNRIAAIIKIRANLLLQDINGEEPVIGDDLFAGLVRQTMQLDLDGLIEPEAIQTFKPHGKHNFSEPAITSVAVPVEKKELLDTAPITSVEEVHTLAGNEHVGEWQEAIAQYLQTVEGEISLPELQEALDMPLVEVWLGLLLGGFLLEQRGDFYSNETIWIKR